MVEARCARPSAGEHPPRTAYGAAVTAAWAASASDAALAAVALWVCARLCRVSLLQPLRLAAIFGALLIASAALVGCLRFAGSASLLPLPTALSNQAARSEERRVGKGG